MSCTDEQVLEYPTAGMSYKEFKRQLEDIEENIYNDDSMKLEKRKKNDYPLNFSMLDIRIGKITRVEENPYSLKPSYLQNIEIGEDLSRLVISDLTKFYSKSELINRKVVVLCNVKRKKQRGLISEAWMLVARMGEHLELLDPPEECDEGDQVTVKGYPPIPDLREERKPSLRKVNEIFKDLTINSERVAVFRGVPLQVEGKHKITVKSAIDCPITDAITYKRIKYENNYNPYIKKYSPKNDPIEDPNPI